jgi:hypothetical protein
MLPALLFPFFPPYRPSFFLIRSAIAKENLRQDTVGPKCQHLRYHHRRGSNSDHASITDFFDLFHAD